MTTIASQSPWFVSVDLEMTGIDPEVDEIIEVGAVRFTAVGRVERYQSLVNPGCPLPYRIRQLTGIRDEDLQSAPPFSFIADEFRAFIGADPVVGQHVGFDLLYLAKRGLRPVGPVYNTAEIAELLLPGLPEYSLRGLARRFAVPFPVQHRALADAEAAMGVFLALQREAVHIDPLVLAQIVALSARSQWHLRYFFRDVEAQRPAEAPNAAPRVTSTPPRQGGSLTPLATRQHVRPEEVEAIFARVASTPSVFSGFEPRPQQVEMAKAVAEALDSDENLLVEAGTGTGKSLAYLLPAACFALRNNERVVVSTNTINLQEQIIGKDVPALRQVLSSCGPADIRAAMPEFRAEQLKGRANYLCLERFAALRAQLTHTDEEVKLATRLLLWLQTTTTGDRAELNLRPEEQAIWTRLSAANADCFSGPSQYVRSGTCQLLRARKRAEAAHVVVVNHALLLSDVAAGGRVLPAYDRLIVDEAHNLEDEATDQFGFSAGQGELRNLLASLDDRSGDRAIGLLADIRVPLDAGSLPAVQAELVRSRLEESVGLVERTRERLPELFARLQAFVAAHGESGGDFDNRLLLTPAKRAQPAWQPVEIAWENLRVALDVLEDCLNRLGTALGDGGGDETLGGGGSASQLGARLVTLLQVQKGIEAIVARHDPDRIAWLTVNRLNGNITLASAPLSVGEVLESYLFARKASVVLTSATLTAAGSFKYVRDRLGLDDSVELALGSPFDYKSAALVLTATDMPEPNRLEYQQALEKAVVSLVRASEGRALVLFTSHGALRTTYRAIRNTLEADGIRVLAQGINGTPRELQDALKTEHGTVLLGTASFWEGVDVVGEALSLLIIAKLPFSVPSDPVFAARSELFEDPFNSYALPQSVLRFKQGFGRLIRHRTDKGVLVVLDRRLRSKRYGRTFLQSLPDCTVKDVPLSDLALQVKRWLRAAHE